MTISGAANAAPIAYDKSVMAYENIAFQIALSTNQGVVSIVNDPSHGTLTDMVTNIGTTLVTYTPGPNYNGVDSFTFKVNDGISDSNIATVTITIKPTCPFISDSGGKIAFSSNREGNYEIYIMNPDGTDQTRLTTDIATDRYPAWSPDGSMIAFSSDRDGHDEIYIMRKDGTEPTRITPIISGVSNYQPDWSPDGTKIVFTSFMTSQTDSRLRICTIYPDGNGLTCVLDYDLTSLIGFPSWSPDNSKIVFHSKYDLLFMNADGTGRTQIHTNKWNPFSADLQPDWSPDGSTIAFVTTYNLGGISVVKPDGTEQIRVSNTVLGGQPTWSPDGSMIAFASSGDSEIYTMSACGAGPTRLTLNTAIDKDPDWGIVQTPGSLEVKSSPSHARIYINGLDTGKFAKWTFDDMAPGDYYVYVMLEGYTTPETEHVTVISEQTAKLHFMLKKEGTPVPEFPSAFLPATVIAGFLGTVLLIHRTRKH
jgi:TolB protein